VVSSQGERSHRHPDRRRGRAMIRSARATRESPPGRRRSRADGSQSISGSDHLPLVTDRDHLAGAATGYAPHTAGPERCDQQIRDMNRTSAAQVTILPIKSLPGPPPTGSGLISGSVHPRPHAAAPAPKPRSCPRSPPPVAPRAPPGRPPVCPRYAREGPQRLTCQGSRSDREATPQAPLTGEERPRTMRGATGGPPVAHATTVAKWVIPRRRRRSKPVASATTTTQRGAARASRGRPGFLQRTPTTRGAPHPPKVASRTGNLRPMCVRARPDTLDA
jgi:hypothetical protein